MFPHDRMLSSHQRKLAEIITCAGFETTKAIDPGHSKRLLKSAGRIASLLLGLDGSAAASSHGSDYVVRTLSTDISFSPLSHTAVRMIENDIMSAYKK